jgi:ATP-dependent Clp protease ATP-binding subunit ClpA
VLPSPPSAMEFRYHCFVIRHASERVTVVPLELPQFTVHGASVERATDDVQLAVDDRIARAHPGRLGEFARSTAGELLSLDVAAMSVWGASETFTRAMKLTAVVAPAHKPFIEVRLPRLDLRLWLPSGPDLASRANEMVKTHLLGLSEVERLLIRAEGAEAIEAITVEPRPVKLASLKPRELHMPERPPPKPADVEEDDGSFVRDSDLDEDQFDSTYDDSWDPPKGGTRATSPKRPAMPTLRRLGVALHEAAQRGDLERAFERDDLVDVILARTDEARPEPLVLVGPPGVGKTAIVHEAIVRMMAADAPESRRTRPVFHLDGSRWIAGEGFFGDWQAQVIDVLAEARKGRALIHLGHIVDLLDAGRSAHSDQNVAQLLGPALAARDVAVIGEATPEEWSRIEQRNASFARAWSVIRVDEPTPATTELVLAQVGARLAAEHSLDLAPGAVATIGALARRFWPYGSAVGNGVNLLRRFIDASAHARHKRVGTADAIEHFSGESGIPRALLRDDITLDTNEVKAFLATRVIGQEHAVERVAEVIAVIKAGLSDVRRPIGVLFFAGPTGVGKTELSKALAEFVFGARDRLVRLDMGEYSGPDALARLLGEGEGGHIGALTAAVRRQPFSLVLLDEIEKAHPAVFDALLGVLGEGRLTDASGRFTDFRNTVIVMTSNLGAETLRARVGFGGEAAFALDAVRKHYIAEAERFFRPELFNRIDDFIVFAPLGGDPIRRIVEREVSRIAEREGFRRHDVLLEVSSAGFDVLAARGLDPRYGARPLKRTLERELVVPIANHLASHPGKAAVRVRVDGDDGRVTLRTESIAKDEAGTGDAIRALLDDAGSLRAEIRQWWRSRFVTELRHRVSFFDKASREASFWRERSLAEDAAARASAARELLDALADLGRQAEASEDLAFEAYYERYDLAVDPLRDELRSLREQLSPLKIRIYASMFPPRSTALLYLQASRTAWPHVEWLLGAYTKWSQSQGLRSQIFTLRYVDPKERPGTPKDSLEHGWKWVHRAPDPNDRPHPLAVALALSGGAEALLLAAEHGAHRFQDGSMTSVVRVRFEPRGASAPHVSRLVAAKELEEAMPQNEIRRIQPTKETVHDARLRREFAFKEKTLDMPAMLGAYVSFRVFGSDGDAWS